MNLYLLKRHDYDWDEYASAVVAALSPSEARELANRALRAYSDRATSTAWNTNRASIERVGVYTGPRKLAHVVHDHFHAG